MASPSDDRLPKPESGVDEIVRAQLDAEASRVDADGMWNRVLTRLEAEAEASAAPAKPAAKPSPRHKSLGRWFAIVVGVAGLAASIFIAVFVLDSPRQAMATPTEIVRDARSAHAHSGDRCYTQSVHLSGGLLAKFPLLAEGERTVTICNRGNRFVVEPGFGGRGAWGRDEAGRVWVAPTREAAARFDESELPASIREAVKIRGLELDTLLDDVLKDFDLEWGEPPQGSSNFTIKATRRGQVGFLQLASAVLVIEKDTKLVRSLVLRRHLGPEAVATISFTLTGSTEKDSATYTPEGHVDPGKPVYDNTRPLLRGLVITRLLKERAAEKQ